MNAHLLTREGDSAPGSPQPKKPIQLVLALLIVLTLLGIPAVTCVAQASVEEFRIALSAKGGFTNDDWSAVERGEIVTKLLPVVDKREVSVSGVARLRATPEVIVKAFKEGMTQQNTKSILGIGKFSNPPTLADVETLSLENRDIEELKQCAIGKCEMKLSAAMIGRFHREVNWSAPDYQLQATRLFRQMLVDYVRDYRARGEAALIEYHDQRRPVSIRADQQALLDRTLYINDFTPEFVSYFKNFPNSELSNVESSINWTKLKFGLKPVIIVTHVMTYGRSHNGAYQIISLSNHIYANHYSDSSLALTTVISFPTNEEVPDSYLLYSNHSRSDSLLGSFSRLKRSLVESESIEKLNALLLQTLANVEVISANQPGPTPTSARQKITDWLFRGTRQYALLLALVVLVFLIVLSRRYSRRIQHRGAQERR